MTVADTLVILALVFAEEFGVSRKSSCTGPVSTDGGTAKPVNVSYVASGTAQPYTFTFHADVFHSGKISSIKATSDKDDIVVKSSDSGCQAAVSIAVIMCSSQ